MLGERMVAIVVEMLPIEVVRRRSKGYKHEEECCSLLSMMDDDIGMIMRVRTPGRSLLIYQLLLLAYFKESPTTFDRLLNWQSCKNASINLRHFRCDDDLGDDSQKRRSFVKSVHTSEQPV